MTSPRIDQAVLELIPHRRTMLLLNELLNVDAQNASASITIGKHSSFSDQHGNVPCHVGIEYMGQTAALIAGHQKQLGIVGDHLGLLIGVRSYSTNQTHFKKGQRLTVTCTEKAVVGDSLANFSCEISDAITGTLIASGELSVFRQKPTTAEVVNT